MGILEKNPEVAKLLVHLYDSQRLYGLAKDDNARGRAELANVMSDLLSLDLSENERELLADILVGLMRQAEKDLRKALAQRLATMDTVPLRMVLHIANDEISVADPILKHSPVLHDVDLVYLIKSTGSDHWQSIASRKNLGETVIDTLAETKDSATAKVLVNNDAIRLTDNAMSVFTTMAKSDEDLARPLLMRPELPAGLAGKLYGYVGEALQDYIRRVFPNQVELVNPVVDEIVLEFTEVEKMEITPSTGMMAMADYMVQNNELTVDAMKDTLRRGQIPSFVAMFSRFSGLSALVVEEMIHQDTGQGLAIACKALGVQKSDFVNIFLLTHRVRHKGMRIVDQNALSKAIRYYERIDPKTAQNILRGSKN